MTTTDTDALAERIARALRQETDDGADRTEDYAAAVLPIVAEEVRKAKAEALREDADAEFDRFLARVRRDAADEVGQYVKRHHPDGLTEKTTVLGYIDTAADRLGRGIHANGRGRETP